MPLILSGDFQAAMNKLHTEEKNLSAVKPGAPEPEKAGGLLKSLFSKK